MNPFDAVDGLNFLPTACGCTDDYKNRYCRENILDISPRHQDLSNVPLEVLEDIHKVYNYYLNMYDLQNIYRHLWHHRECLPSDFGPVKNWFAFTWYYPNQIIYVKIYTQVKRIRRAMGFMINIKDLRVAFYFMDTDGPIVHAFKSYQEYSNAKNVWSKYSFDKDFAFYWGLRQELFFTEWGD